MINTEISFSEHFGLNKTQSELDFVNVPVNTDIPLFIDPYALSQRIDRWSINSHQTLICFFQKVVDYISENRRDEAIRLLSFLREPNETRFGYSIENPQGAGIGHFQADQLYSALLASTAIRTGFIQSLEECELMVDGVNRDKISDLTTNVIRKILAEYTLDQCKLHNIPTSQVALPPYYSKDENRWISTYYDLPLVSLEPVLLVPKIIARFDPAYNHNKYYRKFILEYLQAEHLTALDSLVHTLRDGRRVVYKKEVERDFPKTKQNIFRFSKEHPKLLERYREYLSGLEEQRCEEPLSDDDQSKIAEILTEAIKSVPFGSENASTYHNLMIGILEFIFFPNLIHPIKEREINEGRKRIDILMENGAKHGIFSFLPNNRQYPCAFIAFECKNYSEDLANPELDQMIGRFSTNRGKIGFICCRKLENPTLFNKRCVDTFTDQMGLIIYLDDIRITQLLLAIKDNNRNSIDDYLTNFINDVWLG
jgi:hypothetical protein